MAGFFVTRFIEGQDARHASEAVIALVRAETQEKVLNSGMTHRRSPSPPKSPQAASSGTSNPSSEPKARRARRRGAARWLSVHGRSGYTSGMKTAISIPDALFADAERLARRLKKSRSALFSDAVAEYLARHDPEAITEAMNEVCSEVDARPDPALSAAARRILERSEW